MDEAKSIWTSLHSDRVNEAILHRIKNSLSSLCIINAISSDAVFGRVGTAIKFRHPAKDSSIFAGGPGTARLFILVPILELLELGEDGTSLFLFPHRGSFSSSSFSS